MAHYSGVYSAPRSVILGRELKAQMRAFELRRGAVSPLSEAARRAARGV